MAAQFLRAFASICLLIFVSACAERDAENARTAKEALLGYTQSQIRMCAGLPTGTSKDGAGEIWMYEHAAASPGGITPSIPTLPVGVQVSGASGGYCRVQLRFTAGRVAEVQYAGASDLLEARDAVCGPIVRNCVGPQAKR